MVANPDLVQLDPPPMGRPFTSIDPDLAREAAAIVEERDRLQGDLDANRKRRDDFIVKMKAAGFGADIIARVLGMSKARVLGVLKEKGA